MQPIYEFAKTFCYRICLFHFCFVVLQHFTEGMAYFTSENKCFYDVSKQWHFLIMNLQPYLSDVMLSGLTFLIFWYNSGNKKQLMVQYQTKYLTNLNCCLGILGH